MITFFKKWPNIKPHTSLCKQLVAFRPENKFLDATNTTHIKFRLNNFHRNLPIRKYTLNLAITTTDKCARCHTHVETIEHLWLCEDTCNQIIPLQTEFDKNYHERPDTDIIIVSN
jgi:hypothetical protein